MIMRNAISCLLAVLLLLPAACANRPYHTATREIIATEAAPEAAGPYSQAVRSGNTLYLAGQVGLDPGTGKLAGASLQAQARQALQNIEAVLRAAGFTPADVVDIQVFMTDVSGYDDFNKLYGEWFGASPPARTLLEVAELPLGALVEIKVTAVRSE